MATLTELTELIVWYIGVFLLGFVCALGWIDAQNNNGRIAKELIFCGLCAIVVIALSRVLPWLR